jgi:hypothetical protein
LGLAVFAAYIFAFRYLKQAQQQLDITDEMIAQYQRDQRALCPSGFAPLASSNDCINLRGMVVPKRKQQTASEIDASNR